MNTADIRKSKIHETLRFALLISLYLAIIAAVAFCHGCAAPGELPPGAIDCVTNYAQRVVVAVREAREQDEDPATGSPGAETGVSSGVAGSASSSTTEHTENTEGASTSSQTSVPSVSSVVLDFRYGGFDGSTAKEDPRCRLSSPKITKDRIGYKWETKIPSDWKRFTTSKGPMVVAAAFYWDEGAKKWVGGKMDWTDEARTSRACSHIHDGYNGWKSAGWDAAKRRAFCVVSADGRLRSNLLEE